MNAFVVTYSVVDGYLSVRKTIALAVPQLCSEIVPAVA